MCKSTPHIIMSQDNKLVLFSKSKQLLIEEVSPFINHVNRGRGRTDDINQSGVNSGQK